MGTYEENRILENIKNLEERHSDVEQRLANLEAAARAAGVSNPDSATTEKATGLQNATSEAAETPKTASSTTSSTGTSTDLTPPANESPAPQNESRSDTAGNTESVGETQIGTAKSEK